MDLISVIVPVYNVEQYLERSILSILNQTYENLELLLIDDCSTDGSRGLMQTWAERDSRIRCLLQDRNQGVSAARNRGLNEARGEWICFCDSDDWYEPDCLEKMAECARNEHADYVICDYQIVSDGKAPMKAGSVDALYTGCEPRLVVACGPLSSANHMFRRTLFERSGARYPTQCRQYEEMAVVPVLAAYADRIGVVQKALYNYYQRGDGSSASNARVEYLKNFHTAIEKMKQALGSGYEKELEYHAVYALHYGDILNLCKQGASGTEIRERIRAHEQAYPDYVHNPYLSNLGRAKRAFLLAERLRMIWALRAFAGLHSRLIG